MADSDDFGKKMTCILDSPGNALYVPREYALGTLALENSYFLCMCGDNVFNSSCSSGFRWDDLEVNIDWPIIDGKVRMSDADRNLPEFKDCY